jgi:hypothetical protein
MLRPFESKHVSQRVQVDDEVFKALFEAASAAGGKETGGILIGRYEGTRLALVEHATTAPADSRRGYNWFHRGTKGLEQILQEHWDAPVRRYYVGEWHFHPAPDTMPSDRDIAQMLEVASEQRYECSQPILIIIARNGDRTWLLRVLLFSADGSVDELIVSNPIDPIDQ